MNLLIENTGVHWQDVYQLLDCGDGYKIEKFGHYTLLRPEPQALWRPNISIDVWNNDVDAYFIRDSSNPEKGKWHRKKSVKDPWHLDFYLSEANLRIKLSFSSFKHVGLFPEQISNWLYIKNFISTHPSEKPRMLNLFAYTGVASVVAAASGATVTHVDAVKQVITWANENKKLNTEVEIRWIVDDALKFVQREARRHQTYDIILLDPPAYGRGPNGEKWVLQEHLDLLLSTSLQILKEKNATLVLNLYSLGMSPTLAYTHLFRLGCSNDSLTMHELCVTDTFGKVLPLGTCVRYVR